MRARRAVLAACAALAVVPLAGCGGGDDRSIPHDRGTTLIRLLKEARSQAGDPDQCDALLRTVSAIQVRVGGLPPSVDGDTRQSLNDGVENLAQSAQQECENAQTTPEETTPTTESAPEPPPSTSETTPPPSTSETTPPPPTTTPPPPTTPGNGGAVPPGQEKKGGEKKDKPAKGHDKRKEGGK